MATNRNAPQHSITLYPELRQLTERAEEVTQKPKSRLLYDACVRGLRESLREHEQNLVTIEYECSPEEAAHLQDLVSRSGMTQSEFLRRLIYDYSEQLVAKERQGESGFAPGDHYVISASSQMHQCGDGSWTSRYESGVFESPIVHVFVDQDGDLTFDNFGDACRGGANDGILPLASISDLQAQPEWVEATIHLDWHVRVREGVVQRYCEHDGTVVWADW